MDMQQAGESHNQLIIQLHVMYFYLSLSTERRWHDLSTNLGHYRQCRRTGNRRALVLCDHDQILLALYRVAFPSSNLKLCSEWKLFSESKKRILEFK